ncbi:MAG: helix-turn-helix transcriptional regulator, partial [Acidobacteria bacterium]|nr:helix-turn-helix transcriptional regulator [Acidobacteriota bacterium]
MAFDLTLFSNKLRRYRTQFDVSIEHLATATGLSVEVLTCLDAGTRTPTGDEVLILADYFKCDYKFFISNEQLAPLEQTDKLFRKHGGDLTPADRWAIQEFLYLCECEAFLLDVLQRPAPRLFTFTKKGSYFKGHGEAAARELRRHLGFVENAIRGDIFAVFREIGVHIFRRRLENSRISGLYLKHPTAGKCVLVNYSEDVFRQR